jgi:hypothetical protein
VVFGFFTHKNRLLKLKMHKRHEKVENFVNMDITDKNCEFWSERLEKDHQKFYWEGKSDKILSVG